MAVFVITFNRFNGANDLRFAVVAGHNNEIAAIKLPVAEVDDLRMTAIVLFQQGLGSAGNRAANGF